MRLRNAVVACVALLILSATPAAFAAAGNPAFDLTFSRDGVAVFDNGHPEVFWQVVPSPDGRVYGVGETWARSRAWGLVVAFDSQGRLDPTFSGDGVFTKAVGGKTWFTDAAALPSGELLVVGAGDDYNSVVAMRLGHDGTVDPTFAGGPRLLPQNGSPGAYVFVALDSVGNAYVAADSVASFKPRVSDVWVTKLDSAGATVGSFGLDGDAYLDVTRRHLVNGLAVDAQDRPMALVSICDRSGSPTNVADLARLTSSGALDPTFDGDGWASFSLPSGDRIWPMDVQVGSGGAIYVGSKTWGVLKTRVAVHKFTSSGGLDPSYSGDGVVFVRTGLTVAGSPLGGALLADGSYVFALSIERSTDQGWVWDKPLAVRITPTGALDQTFGRNGFFIPDLRKGWERFVAASVDGSGRLLLSGYDAPSAFVVRLTVPS